MKKSEQGYRMLSDTEPKEKELTVLMHEVAVDAEKRSDIAKKELAKKIKLQISEALMREGYSLK
jgi:hypothetical protein